jgi:hypothetical protein
MVGLAKVLLFAAMTTAISCGQDVSFYYSYVVDSHGREQANAGLNFAEAARAIVVWYPQSVIMVIPYDSITRLACSRNRRFEIHYRKAGVEALFALKLDKSEYTGVIAAAKAATGKEVEIEPEEKKSK